MSKLSYTWNYCRSQKMPPQCIMPWYSKYSITTLYTTDCTTVQRGTSHYSLYNYTHSHGTAPTAVSYSATIVWTRHAVGCAADHGLNIEWYSEPLWWPSPPWRRWRSGTWIRCRTSSSRSGNNAMQFCKNQQWNKKYEIMHKLELQSQRYFPTYIVI